MTDKVRQKNQKCANCSSFQIPQLYQSEDLPPFPPTGSFDMQNERWGK